MIIRVEKHTTQYSIIDNTGLNDIRLSLKARGLLGYLLTKPDNWEVTVQGIISQVPDGPTAVQSALKEMECFGYAEYRTVRGDRGRLGGKKWVIIERPSSQNIDLQASIPNLSSHRQAGFPIIGKTDNRLNRLSGNPLQVSTNSIVSTDYKDNTNLNADARKKTVNSKPNSCEAAPPVPAPPPSLFSESGWPEKGLECWRSNLLAQGFPETVDTDHYYRRCQSWSNKNSKKAQDWIAFATGIAIDDSNQSKLKLKSTKQHASNNTSPGPSPSHSGTTSKAFDKDRTLARAARILGKTG